MSRIGLTAIMLVVISATAASACCFFKCCFKSSSPGAIPVPTTVKASMSISSVDSQTPVLNDIANAVDHPKEDIVVESDFDPTSANPELTVTDDGPRTAAVPTVTTSSKKYKPVKILKVEKPTPVAAPAPGPSPAPPPSKPGPVWLTFYSVDLDPYHNYRTFATAGTMTTSTVTFRTKP